MRVCSESEGKQLVGLQCNCCGKKIVVNNGIVREGNIAIDFTWDYFSEKDGETHSFDLCEECYDQITSQFKIPVDIQDEIMLI